MDHAFFNAQYLEKLFSTVLQDQGVRTIDIPRHTIRRMAGRLPLRFLLEEVVEDGSVVFEIIVRDREAARSADLMDVNNDDAASPRNALHLVLFDKVVERRRVLLEHSAAAEQSHDPRRSLVGIQHDRHSVVAWLVDVRDGLVATAGQLVVPEGLAVQDAKVFAAFGRDVHVSVAGERRCADKEHLLV
jgi:hypothetical protein